MTIPSREAMCSASSRTSPYLRETVSVSLTQLSVIIEMMASLSTSAVLTVPADWPFLKTVIRSVRRKISSIRWVT